MHSKSTFTYLRFVMLALTGVSAILLSLALGLQESWAAAPAVQGRTNFGTTGQSHRAASRRPPRIDQLLSPSLSTPRWMKSS